MDAVVDFLINAAAVSVIGFFLLTSVIEIVVTLGSDTAKSISDAWERRRSR